MGPEQTAVIAAYDQRTADFTKRIREAISASGTVDRALNNGLIEMATSWITASGEPGETNVDEAVAKFHAAVANDVGVRFVAEAAAIGLFGALISATQDD